MTIVAAASYAALRLRRIAPHRRGMAIELERADSYQLLVATAAVARELLGFVWSIGQRVPLGA